jgi:hypothetical protein
MDDTTKPGAAQSSYCVGLIVDLVFGSGFLRLCLSESLRDGALVSGGRHSDTTKRTTPTRLRKARRSIEWHDWHTSVKTK